jgi:hypothetical protein
LSIDEDGFLHIESPSFSKIENGVIGYGKEMTRDEVSSGSKFLKQKFEESFPEYPKILMTLAGMLLADIAQEKEGFVLTYSEFSATHDIPQMSIQKCDCADEEEYIARNLTNKNTKFQEIGDTIITVNGSTNVGHHAISFFQNYDVGFVKDGYEFLVIGKTLDEIKQDIVSNYFQDYSPDDFTERPSLQ